MEENIQQKFNAKQNEVRLQIMNFIIDKNRAFHKTEDGFCALPEIKLSNKDEFDEILSELAGKDGFSADEGGDINFIYPVSALPTNHHVTLADGREFTAMCAIDAIGAAFTFHQDTEIHSVCCMCGEPIHLKIQNGQVAEHSPEGLHALTFTLGEITNWADSC